MPHHLIRSVSIQGLLQPEVGPAGFTRWNALPGEDQPTSVAQDNGEEFAMGGGFQEPILLLSIHT